MITLFASLLIACLQGRHSPRGHIRTLGTLVHLLPVDQNILRDLRPHVTRSLRGASGKYCNRFFWGFLPPSKKHFYRWNWGLKKLCQVEVRGSRMEGGGEGVFARHPLQKVFPFLLASKGDNPPINHHCWGKSHNNWDLFTTCIWTYMTIVS